MAEKNTLTSAERVEPSIIPQESSTIVRIVPVPWFPPVRTSRLRPGVPPTQVEIRFGSADPSPK